MRKRAVSLVLCLCMILSLLPVPILATGTHPFTDVATTDWFNDSVQYVYDHGLMNGTSSNTFEPYKSTQRGMIVTILHRLEGTPAVSTTCPFTDVPHGSNYENAIMWAASNNIVNGYTETAFGPYDNISRQQMAAILYRYAQMKNYRTSINANLNEYKDFSQISNYARVAMAWANAEGLINGNSNKELMPTGTTTRAQAAAILTRFCENVVSVGHSTQTPTITPTNTPTPTPTPEPIVRYTVTFDLNYPNAAASQTVSVEKGQKVAVPTNPIRSGYDFNGWYTTSTGGSLFNFNVGINADTTVYAGWSYRRSSGGGGGGSGSSTTYRTVTFNTNGGSSIASKRVVSGRTVERPTDPTKEGYVFGGWYSDSTLNTQYDFNVAVVSNLILYAKWNGNDEFDLDTDGDGLIDAYEIFYGTDINLPDTDGDTVNDYEEILLGTDPLTPDALGDNSDIDGDGITDADEIRTYGTDPTLVDTDGDSLTDYDEIFTYHSNPLQKDTDEDELDDGFEIAHGLDPTKVSSNGEIPDNAVKLQQQSDENCMSDLLNSNDNVAIPFVSGSVNGELAKNLFIAELTDSSIDENRAKVGSAILIDAEDDYISGLTLGFDLEAYATAGEDMQNLVICKLDESGDFNPLESIVSDNKITCELQESGSYFVLDLDVFLNSLGINVNEYELPESALYSLESQNAQEEYNDAVATLLDSQAVSGQADIVFAIDTTSSMSDEIANVVANITNFTETLARNYNVMVNYALIDFKDLEEDGADTTKIIKNGSSNWFNTASSFASQVNSLTVSGGGDNPECDIDALETARNLNYRTNASKFVILVTDADYKILNSYGITSLQQEADLLKADGIIASVITLTELTSSYQTLIDTTGGVFADIYNDFSVVLLQLAELIGEETSGNWAILKHGYRYVKIPSESNGDYDGDGLTDTYELGEKETISLSLFIKARLALSGVPFESYYGKTAIEVYNAVSDPTTSDTDGDGILDNEDTAPWKKGLADGTIGELNLISCGGAAATLIALNYVSEGKLGSGNTGHSFIVYQSIVNDTLDLSVFNRGYVTDTGSWRDCNEVDATGNYTVAVDDAVSMGAGGIFLSDAKCAVYNMEFYKHFAPDVEYSYQPNTYLCEKITQTQLDKLLKAFKNESSKEYKPVMHNCTHVALEVWNDVFGTKYNPIGINTPKGLMGLINNKGGSQNYDLDNVIE